MVSVCTCKLCREFEPPIKKSSLLALFRYMKEEPQMEYKIRKHIIEYKESE